MKEKTFKFGDRGIWHCPASDDRKKQDIPAVVLEQTKEGVLYIFTDFPIRKKYNNLTYRTATIFPSDFTLTTLDLRRTDSENAINFFLGEGQEPIIKIADGKFYWKGEAIDDIHDIYNRLYEVLIEAAK